MRITPKSGESFYAAHRDYLSMRFGKIDDEVRALLQVTAIRIAAEQKGIVSVETDGSKLKLIRAGAGRRDDFVQMAGCFPRLIAPKPVARLKEILGSSQGAGALLIDVRP